MNPNQKKDARQDEDTIEEVTGDEAEKVAGGGIYRGSGMDEPNDDPPGGQLSNI